MAAAIKRETGADAELIPGGGGVFDVVADDQLIFSKHDEGRYPDEGEVCASLGRS